MSIIQKKLLGIQKKYSLTISDLAVLLESNRSTVHAWLSGVAPFPTRIKQLEDRITAIVTAEKCFPVPLSVTQFQRKQYLLDALNGRVTQIPRSGSSSRR